MAWTLYRVTWRLESPLHSGFAKLGNIQRTRMYVTGRILWGALTARLTRDQGSNDYETVGKAVNECLAFSYGYLCLTEDGSQPLLPVYEAEGLHYRIANLPSATPLPARIAQRLCLSSYASTAIDYSNNAAIDGSLHEVEFISPRALCDENDLGVKAGQPLYLTALIAEAENASTNSAVKDWRDACRRLEVGGERAYGFGKLTRVSIDNATDWFGGEFIGGNSRPAVRVQKGGAVTAHAAVGGVGHRISLGQIEPFIGRTTTPKAEFGEKVECAGVYWLPGSVVDVDEVSYKIDQQGRWDIL